MQPIRTQLTSTFGILIGLLFCLIGDLASGQNIYPQDTTICSLSGEPNDSLIFYFPATIKTTKGNIPTEINSFQLKWYSTSIRPTNEPILFNYFQGHDIYRFVWLRSFSAPVVISLHKDGEKVWLQTKLLDCIPRDFYISYVKFEPPGKHHKKTNAKENSSTPKVDAVVHKVRVAKIIKDESKLLTAENWNNFESLLAQCNYWNMKTSIHEKGIDGSQWIIEGHQKSRYWFVDRFSPRDNYRKCGEYLIKLSGLYEKIY
jgi:hypothetical protein